MMTKFVKISWFLVLILGFQGTWAKASLWDKQNCFVLNMRADTEGDIGILCVDPLLNPQSTDVRLGDKFLIKLFRSAWDDDSSFLPLNAFAMWVDHTGILGNWFIIEGNDGIHRLWMRFGPGFPPIAKGSLSYLAGEFTASIKRYVWEPAGEWNPKPKPKPCNPGHACK